MSENENSEKVNTEDSGTDVLEEITSDSTDESKIPVLQQLSVAFGILALIFGTTYIDDVLALVQPENDEGPKIQAQVPQLPIETIEKEDYFENIDVTAESVYVWDVREQRALFNKSADVQLPLASVTKLMTALVAHELIDTDEMVNIPIDAILQSGDSGLTDGELFELQDLSDLTLVTSSNDGAYALAAAAGSSLTDGENTARTFVEAMNIRAEEIGLSQTYFKNPTGLDLSTTEAGAYGSARDMTFLMEYIIVHYPDLLEITKEDILTIPNTNGEMHLAENTNHFVSDIQGLIASKTGYTDLAGGNLIVAFDVGLNRPIIISVLGSTRNERFDDVLQLVEQTKKHLVNNN